MFLDENCGTINYILGTIKGMMVRESKMEHYTQEELLEELHVYYEELHTRRRTRRNDGRMIYPLLLLMRNTLRR
jgi:hypothetical protein